MGVIIKIVSRSCTAENNIITADAGAQLSQLVILSTQNGLAGMEWAVGIPGTVGGGISGNAGAYGSDISKVLQEVEVWRDGEILKLKNKQCDFGYRTSVFKTNQDVILRATIKLKQGDKKEILSKVQEHAKQRSGRISTGPTCGCFFCLFLTFLVLKPVFSAFNCSKTWLILKLCQRVCLVFMD